MRSSITSALPAIYQTLRHFFASIVLIVRPQRSIRLLPEAEKLRLLQCAQPQLVRVVRPLQSEFQPVRGVGNSLQRSVKEGDSVGDCSAVDESLSSLASDGQAIS